MPHSFTTKLVLILAAFVSASLSLLSAHAVEKATSNGKAKTELRVAVASNFAVTARALIDEFSLTNSDSIQLFVGATGKHASQIRHGFNVDIFLAADSARPEFLEDNGYAVRGSRFTYALGRLVLWSKDPLLADRHGIGLTSSNFNYLAIANPKTAPYGVAAKQVLAKLGVSPRLVNGESVGQAFLFADSGNAEFALIALAQVKDLNKGGYWLVPDSLYQPIEQQAVLVKESTAARNFLRFLSSEPALTIIESAGYYRPNSSLIGAQ